MENKIGTMIGKKALAVFLALAMFLDPSAEIGIKAFAAESARYDHAITVNVEEIVAVLEGTQGEGIDVDALALPLDSGELRESLAQKLDGKILVKSITAEDGCQAFVAVDPGTNELVMLAVNAAKQENHAFKLIVEGDMLEVESAVLSILTVEEKPLPPKELASSAASPATSSESFSSSEAPSSSAGSASSEASPGSSEIPSSLESPASEPSSPEEAGPDGSKNSSGVPSSSDPAPSEAPAPESSAPSEEASVSEPPAGSEGREVPSASTEEPAASEETPNPSDPSAGPDNEAEKPTQADDGADAQPEESDGAVEPAPMSITAKTFPRAPTGETGRIVHSGGPITPVQVFEDPTRMNLTELPFKNDKAVAAKDMDLLDPLSFRTAATAGLSEPDEAVDQAGGDASPAKEPKSAADPDLEPSKEAPAREQSAPAPSGELQAGEPAEGTLIPAAPSQDADHTSGGSGAASQETAEPEQEEFVAVNEETKDVTKKIDLKNFKMNLTSDSVGVLCVAFSRSAKALNREINLIDSGGIISEVAKGGDGAVYGSYQSSAIATVRECASDNPQNRNYYRNRLTIEWYHDAGDGKNFADLPFNAADLDGNVIKGHSELVYRQTFNHAAFDKGQFQMTVKPGSGYAIVGVSDGYTGNGFGRNRRMRRNIRTNI